MKSLYEAMLDPELFGKTFAGPTFWAWRCVAKFLDGLPLETAELDLWRAITGRDDPPTEAFREGYIVKPRRAGGTLFAAAVGLHAALQDYSDRLGPGEVAVIGMMAASKDQAGQLMNYCKGLIADSPLINDEVERITDDSITFKHQVQVEVMAGSWRHSRGKSYAAVIADELSFWRSDLSANPAEEVIRAVRPGLVNLRGRLIGLSSPHNRRGHLFAMYQQHFGKATKVLVIQAGGPTLNPTIDQELVAQARIDDPIAARSEWDAQWREDISQFLTDDVIEAALRPGRKALSYAREHRYVAFCDPSGGRHDAMTLGIAHQETGGRCVLDKIVIDKPPFTPETVVTSFQETLSAYGLNRVTGDRYGAEWVVSMFAKVGVIYEPSQKDKSGIYIETLPLFAANLVDLLDSPQLETELRLLERRPRPSGRGDIVDHPPQARDDSANSALGALWLASLQPMPGIESMAGISRTVTEYDPLTRDDDRRGERPDNRPSWMRPTIYL